jgi:hypothetical protein
LVNALTKSDQVRLKNLEQAYGRNLEEFGEYENRITKLTKIVQKGGNEKE